MFTRLRRHLGTAGLLVAVVALVAALGGSAVAANSGGDATASAKKRKKGASGLNAKQKRQVIALAKRFARSGSVGPAGSAGPAGPAGDKGDTGAAGQDGDDASINGVAAGGALSGTYPNPTLAAGSVNTAQFAAGATAPNAANAAMLGGILPSGFQKDVSGTCAVGSAIRDIATDGTVTCESTGIGTVTSVGSGAGLTGGPITGSGTLAVDLTVVQNRVSSTCAVGDAIRVINQDGTVVCQSVGGGGGGITEVTVSDGLTGGGTSSSVNVGVDSSQIQSRVSGTCAVGTAIRAINADGTVTCETAGGGGGGLPATLPVGSTQTGTYGFNGTVGDNDDGLLFGVEIPISFPIPLAAPLDASEVHYSTESNFTDFDGGGGGTVGCTGTVSVPAAPSGHLCIYENGDGSGGPMRMTYSAVFDAGAVDFGAGAAGAHIAMSVDDDPGWAFGTFAVTG